MELKKVAIRSSVHPIGKLDGIYAKLSKAMGEELPLAQLSIGHGFRTWSDKRFQWHPLSEATAEEVDAINKTSEQIRNKLLQYADSKTVDALLTIPDDSYLFFNNDDSEMHIILTGWGFKKPGPVGTSGLEIGKVKVKKKKTDPEPEPKPETPPKPEPKPIPEPEPVPESEPQPPVEPIEKPEPPILEPKPEPVKPEPTPAEADILVTVKENGEPVEGKEITISYGNELLSGITDAVGQVNLHVTVKEDVACTVSVDDYDEQTKDSLEKDAVNEFVFDREVELPPVMPVPQVKVTVLDSKGNPLKCTGISFSQEGKETLNGQLDETGSTTFDSTRFDTGKDLSVLITGTPTTYPPIVFQLDEGELEYVLQEKQPESNWWLSLLEIAAVVAVAVIVYFVIWPAFTDIASDIYHGLYN